MFFKHKWHIVYFLPMFTEAIYRSSTDKQGLIVTSTSSLMTHGNFLQHIQSDEQITDKATIKNWTSFEGEKSETSTVKQEFKVKTSNEKYKEYRNTTKWTSPKGCFAIEKLDEHSTHTHVQKVFKESFNKSRFSFKIENTLYSCSIRCFNYMESEFFAYFKTVCQCIENQLETAIIVNIELTKNYCKDNTSCIYCSDGKGVPIYETEEVTLLRKSDGLPQNSIFSDRCIIESKLMPLKNRPKERCLQLLQKVPCDFKRIIFQIKSIGLIEWVCESQDGHTSTHGFFRVHNHTDADGKIPKAFDNTINTATSVLDYTNKQQNITIAKNADNVNGVYVYNAVILVLIVLFLAIVIILYARKKRSVQTQAEI